MTSRAAPKTLRRYKSATWIVSSVYFVVAVLIVLICVVAAVGQLEDRSFEEDVCSCLGGHDVHSVILTRLHYIRTRSRIDSVHTSAPWPVLEGRIKEWRQLSCLKITVLSEISSVVELHKKLSTNSRCTLWVVPDLNSLNHSAHGVLKGVFEDGVVHGKSILSNNGKALFVLRSELSRKELLDVMPHRTVFMMFNLHNRT